ncbi:hypothetical protein BGW36DRAFT_430773 [Talaromyces proteolyticus]|uniref:Uncharacterized protein n=1 Tax=Talaromyces proteolyticus TaxID=1131652 RepID=A0AAD4PXR8_9EURO|nr:uncharacterized protein BGW36DRAFT_430773 [Talaromyces proteolyticus]KAH8693033.1 hypothetical protein BGW36DRAFT_430773 [Talaromyces proteolyticus]
MESPRKRRKKNGELFNPSSASIQTIESKQRRVPTSALTRQIPPLSDPGQYWQWENQPSSVQAVHPYTGQLRNVSMDTRNDYKSSEYSLSQTLPQWVKPYSTQQQIFGTKSWVTVNKKLDPRWNIQMLPRAHIRSCSALSETTRPYLVPPNVRFEKDQAHNSRSSISMANEEAHIDGMLRGAINEAWNPAQRSSEELSSDTFSERVPLLRNATREIREERSWHHNAKLRSMERDVDEDHQPFHVQKYKLLWLVAISIFVGIFLCLFLYAFHII